MKLGPSHIGYYNVVHAGKAWQISGVTIPEGLAYCAECAEFFAHDDKRLGVKFSSDEGTITCDKCRKDF